jgi:acetyltransferase-like isoleucine patch superfamily enzyme
MRKDHRPYFLKRAISKFQRFYANHFLRPHFYALGKKPSIVNPWHVEVFGTPIEVGDYVTIIGASDNKVRLSVWADKNVEGRIHIGDYCILCPGVRISSASEIGIGDNCMIASSAYITDSDWHGIYDRIAFGKTHPIKIENNVWIGDSAIVCKGVTIGQNSIIGAGAVIVNSIPSNCIAAGNPAQIVKQLDPEESYTTRRQWFSEPSKLFYEIDQLDKELLQENTLLHWLRYLFYPSKGD